METADFLEMRRMPSGRYARALRLMREPVAEAGLTALEERIDRGLEVAESTLELELGWVQTRSNSSSARGKAALIDNTIDEQIVAIAEGVRAQTVGDDDDPVVEMAEDFHRTFFSDGVRAITQQAFEVQEGIMDAMMVRFDEDFTDHIEALGQRRAVERLRRLIGEFKAELDKGRDKGVSFDQVRASRVELHEATCKVLVGILYHLDEDDEATVELRNRILEPLMEQQERVAEARRRQRAPTDVDPETGEEILDEPDESADVEPEVEPQPARV